MTLADSASYDQFAWVYNRHFGRYAEQVLGPLNELVLHDFPPPRRILDLCCGTGQLDRALQALGYEITGIDGSPEMIRFARENAPGCEFIVADARAFSVHRPFDAAVCVYDSLNHFMHLDRLREVFRSVHAALQEGAPFVFDLNMEAGFRERWRGSFGIVEDDHVSVFRFHFDEYEKRGEFAATIFRRESGWSRSDFSLEQRCYSAEEVTTALSAEGFSRVSIVDAQQWLSLNSRIGRSFFLCFA